MSRRRFLIGYDIADPKRLRRVIKIMEAYGTRLQYSVFICDLTASEELMWRTNILDVVKLAEDSVVSIELGPTVKPTQIKMIGVPRQLPAQGVQIV